MHLDHDHDETVHTHAHTHTHDHENEHTHSHDDCGHTHCDACGGCEHSPKEELMALMKYMVGHNASHANELANLAKQLQEMGETAAYDQIMLAVSDFEKGNLRLSTVLASMQTPNVYENSVEQKNLILSNVQRIDCKDGFVVLVDLFERETRVEGRLATIDLVGNTAIIVKD